MAEININDIIQSIVNLDECSWTPMNKIPLIQKEIDNIKADTITCLSNNNLDVSAVLAEASDLYIESQALIEEMKICKLEIEENTMAEVVKSIESHDLISKELDTVNFAHNIIKDVVQCENYLREYYQCREMYSFPRAVESVYDLLLFVEKPTDGFDELELYTHVKEMGKVILENLLYDVTKEWDGMVSLKSKTEENTTTVSILLTLSESRLSVDVLNALDKCKRLDEKISELSQFILNQVLVPMMHESCTIDNQIDGKNIILKFDHKQTYKPSYDEVIKNVITFIHYLSPLLDFEFKREVQKSISVMTLIGAEIISEFSDLIIQHVFIHTIPNNVAEFHSYDSITSIIKSFESSLSNYFSFPISGFSLLGYMKNFDFLFAECASRHFLESARAIMLKDLSASMSIGVEKIPGDVAHSKIDEADIELIEALDLLDKTIPHSLFFFPRCMISKSAQELLDLVIGTMEQAVQSPDIASRKLYNTARLIFEMYDAVVPYYHEMFLMSIPQYVALFHNNCMYLAHNLQTLGVKWSNQLEGQSADYAISFLDLVQKLRNLGYKYITLQLQQQRKQILDNIRSSDLNCLIGKDLLGDNAEAAVRQCLRQLQLLKNVWIGVFPQNVFTRLIATLVNMFLDELIHRVCTVEDISVEMATQLTDMYNLVVQKVPFMFHTPMDVEKHVIAWSKFKEIIFILGASLRDLENHWNEGTGPLAVYFTVDELRSLIKALFQNTQFRANFLSKIK